MTGVIKLMLDFGYALALSKAKSKARGATEEKAQIVRWRNIYGVTLIPWSLEYDFLLRRSPVYLRLTKESYESYYRKFFRVNGEASTVTTPSDEHFYRSITNTGNSFYLRPTDRAGVEHMNMAQLMNVELFPGYFFEVRGLEINHNTKEILIITRHNRRIGKGDPSYEQAKIHAMTCVSYFNVGIGHSWVHFQLPCVVSALVFNAVPRDSVLYRIMSVHTRFTMRINHQALRIRRTSNNQDKWSKRLNPFQAFAMTGNTFVENNQARTVDFYKLDGEFSAPPRLNPELPYHRFVGAYYQAIRQFIEDLGDRLELDLVDQLFTALDQYIPASLAAFDRKDLLAAFIWQVSVLHSSDHHTYYKLFRNYSCPMLRHRLEDGEPIQPAAMFDPLNVAKFENFTDVFVKFSYEEKFPNNLAHLTYGFTDPDLQAIEGRFCAELKAVEAKLEQEGLALVPLTQMAQSICF